MVAYFHVDLFPVGANIDTTQSGARTMQKVNVTCEDTGNVIACDVLERSDKRIKIVAPGTTTSFTLQRTDLRKPYIGSFAKLTFSTKG